MDETLAVLRAIGDPVKRYEAAQAAQMAARNEAIARINAEFEPLIRGSVQELVDAHGGNTSAAGRELGISHTAVSKKLAGTKASGTAVAASRRTGAVQAQPALRFADEFEAEDALLDWRLRKEEVEDETEQLLLGALAAGVEPVAVSEAADVGLDRLRRIRPSGNIALSALSARDDGEELFEDFARALTAHAGQMRGHQADPDAVDPGWRIWDLAAHAVVRNLAPYALTPGSQVRAEDFPRTDEGADAWLAAVDTERKEHPERYPVPERPDALVMVSGPDAWLAREWVRYTRQAQQCRVRDGEGTAEMGEAFAALADAIRELRTTGQVPSLTGSEAAS
jgi:hypothetical protein